MIYRILPLMHQDAVPHSHRCRNCGKNKDEVQFKVQHHVNNNTFYVFKLCQICTYADDISDVDMAKAIRRKQIKKDFDKYFKDNI